MQSSMVVIEPAKDISLITLYEAKLALNLSTSNDTTTDDQLEMLIEWSSAEIAALANRTFAKERVSETFRNVDTYYSTRLFLSHWPVHSIEVVDEDGDTLVADDGYEVDARSGTLTRLNAAWGDPVTVTYTGGYDLPYDSPRALRQAALLLTREAYNAAVRGDATIRMIGHKESRVIYFDPNAKSGGGGSTKSPAQRAVGDLLRHFMRFEV